MCLSIHCYGIWCRAGVAHFNDLLLLCVYVYEWSKYTFFFFCIGVCVCVAYKYISVYRLYTRAFQQKRKQQTFIFLGYGFFAVSRYYVIVVVVDLFKILHLPTISFIYIFRNSFTCLYQFLLLLIFFFSIALTLFSSYCFFAEIRSQWRRNCNSQVAHKPGGRQRDQAPN